MEPKDSQSTETPIGDVDDALDLMNEGISEREKGREKDDKGDNEKKENEIETELPEIKNEDEIELEDDVDEKDGGEKEIDLATPSKIKQILKDFPDLQKKYPYFIVAYHRDKQFTELLGTVEDAKEMLERAERYDNIQEAVSKGNVKDLLKDINEEDPQAFKKLTDNYLEDLRVVNKEAYIGVVGGVINQAVEGMVSEAAQLRRNNPKDEGAEEEATILEQAALILNKFMFGTSKFQPNKRRSNEVNEEEEKLSREREDFARTKFEDAQNSLVTRTDNRIRATIERHIDPTSKMTSYVKKNAIKDACNMVEKAIREDRTWRTRIMDPLWRKAVESNYSRSAMGALEEAFTSKAKTLLSGAIKRARREALKDSPDTREETDRRGPLPAGRSQSTSSSQNSGKKREIPKTMSDADFLLGSGR